MSHYDRWVLQAEPFLFARFENAPSESEEAVESRIEVEILAGGTQQAVKASTDQTTAAAFDNPMYGTAQVRKKSLQINLTYEEQSSVFDTTQGATNKPKLRGNVHL